MYHVVGFSILQHHAVFGYLTKFGANKSKKAIANAVFFFLIAIGGVQIASIVADEYRRLGYVETNNLYLVQKAIC